jgi:pimeloyl-ACP methyl ester carboxylesterase
MKKLVPTVAFGCLLAAELLAVPPNAELYQQLEPCKENKEFRCGRFAVPENPAEPAGRKIELSLVIAPAEGGITTDKALFNIAGGPGGSSVDEGYGFAQILAAIRKTHDLVMVDLRGTGESNRLGCQANGNLENDLQGFFTEFLTEGQLKVCREELAKKADVRFYTTPLAVDDLESVRKAYGYGKIDLLGTSYGTRAAQVFMKRHPDSVRSSLLMGVVSLDTYLPTTHAPASERAFDMLITACLEDETCRKAFPNLRQEYEELWQRLEAEPARVEVKNPKTGKMETISFSRGNFAEAIRFNTYNPSGGSVFPLLVHRAWQGDLLPFVEQVLASEPDFRAWFAWGAHLAVGCSEDEPFYPADTSAFSNGTLLGDYRIAMQKQLCAGWPRGQVPANLHAPVVGDIPTLLLSGQYDPVTPPWMARGVARNLSRSKHVVIEHGHHGQNGISNIECLQGLLVQFLEQGSADKLDAGCTGTMKRPAWVTDYEAWKKEEQKKREEWEKAAAEEGGP